MLSRSDLPEPCAQCLLSRSSDHLLIAPRIADHLPQRRDFSGFRKTRLASLRRGGRSNTLNESRQEHRQLLAPMAMGHEFKMMSKVSNIVDVYVGARLRMRRTMLGMSQSRLGELLGVTFQPGPKIRERLQSHQRQSPSAHRARARSLAGYFFEARQRIRPSRALLKVPRNPTSSISLLRPRA